MTAPDSTTDLLIISSGIMGSVVAQLVREASTATSIVLVDGGRPIDAMPGLARARHGRSTDMGAAAAWNVGGVGAYWTAATPWTAGTEVFDHGGPGPWQRYLNTARRALSVTSAAVALTLPGEVVLAELRRRYLGVGPTDRAPQLMPMAVARGPGGRLLRPGPTRIFPPLSSGGDSRVPVLPRTLAVALDHHGRRVRGAAVLNVECGDVRAIKATATVTCARSARKGFTTLSRPAPGSPSVHDEEPGGRDAEASAADNRSTGPAGRRGAGIRPTSPASPWCRTSGSNTTNLPPISRPLCGWPPRSRNWRQRTDRCPAAAGWRVHRSDDATAPHYHQLANFPSAQRTENFAGRSQFSDDDISIGGWTDVHTGGPAGQTPGASAHEFKVTRACRPPDGEMSQ